MRLYHKKQCLETLKLLDEAHGEIAKYIEKGLSGEAVALLEDCQQGAITVGTAVDEEEGDGTDTVHALEEYCETAYQLHEELQQGKDANYRRALKKLRQYMLKAVNGLNNEISTQKEAVFLPYKASMWDSLEPVWRDADGDANYIPVVMPIPYFDKNPDGTFREMHYEITEFPDDVPVVSYEDYDLAAHHPDEIYIHNPYDGYNHVTSVHPAFYSSKLKEYTEKLIYIPYFVLGEIDPDDRKAQEGIEDFVTVPAVLHADLTIVQSEAMKKAYVNILTREVGFDRAFWEKKISGAGSPKVRRVMALKAEDYELPQEWQVLVNKDNGERKKIIFYNTSINALLRDGEAMLAKIEENLKTFEEHRDEVALLWRPHPLIEATLTSMRPQLWEKYNGIVDRYRAAGWGIYDDTANMDRAIAVSDGYYGDWSSLVWLYQKTGKPIMIQNCNLAG